MSDGFFWLFFFVFTFLRLSLLQRLGLDVALEDLEETFLSALETIKHIYYGRILRLVYLKYQSRLRSNIAAESLLVCR